VNFFTRRNLWLLCGIVFAVVAILGLNQDRFDMNENELISSGKMSSKPAKKTHHHKKHHHPKHPKPHHHLEPGIDHHHGEPIPVEEPEPVEPEEPEEEPESNTYEDNMDSDGLTPISTSIKKLQEGANPAPKSGWWAWVYCILIPIVLALMTYA